MWLGRCQNSNSCAPGIATPRESEELLSPDACHLSDMVGNAGGGPNEDIDTTECCTDNSAYEDFL